jgi:hypothetical protein
MTMLSWSKVGERLFEAGLDRGVLYPPAGTPVAWSGLTSIEESVDDDAVAFYIDGIKYLDHEVLGDFSAKLKAFTYPDEFEEFDGVKPIATGLLAHMISRPKALVCRIVRKSATMLTALTTGTRSIFCTTFWR